VSVIDTFAVSRLVEVIVWSCATIGMYWVARQLYRRHARVWFMPVVVTPLLLIGLILCMHETYQHYIHGAGWLVGLLGPTTVAFAAPIYEKRAIIRAHWPILFVGVIAGSLTAMSTSYGLASLLHVDPALRLSLLPSSLNMPFAMAVSSAIGGVPSLTAFFVVTTGVVGALVGDAMVSCLPVRSSIARGAFLGISAHGAGTTKAYQLGLEEGTVAGVVMILSGLLNVAVSPLLVLFLKVVLA
jgi:predicted murein hydrolase (TIGR00659 family)